MFTTLIPDLIIIYVVAINHVSYSGQANILHDNPQQFKQDTCSQENCVNPYLKLLAIQLCTVILLKEVLSIQFPHSFVTVLTLRLLMPATIHSWQHSRRYQISFLQRDNILLVIFSRIFHVSKTRQDISSFLFVCVYCFFFFSIYKIIS